MQGAKKITIVLDRVCPFAHRTALTALEKELEFETKEVSLSNKEPYFTETYRKAFGNDPDSNGKVPILIHGDEVIIESDVTSWYLADAFSSGTQLIPKAPIDKAKMCLSVNLVAQPILTAFFGFTTFKGKSEEEKEAHLKKVDKALKLLSNQIKGPYLMGDQFTLGDIMIYPFLERWPVLKTYFGVDKLPDHPKIVQWLQKVGQRASVQKIRQTDEYFAEKYKSYFS